MRLDAETLERLRRSELLSDIPEPDFHALVALGRTEWVAKGGLIAAVGRTADRLHLVLEGRVCSITPTEAGSLMVMEVLGPGALLGDADVCDGGPSLTTTTARTPVSLMSWGRTELLAFLRSHPDTTMALLLRLTARLRIMGSTSDRALGICGT